MGGRQSFAQYQYTLQGDTPRSSTRRRPKLVPGPAEGPDLRGRHLRPAGGRAGEPPGDRPRHRLPLRHHPGQDRQHPLRRLRPAPGLDDLQPAEPVPRRDGDRAALPGETRRPSSRSTSRPRAATRAARPPPTRWPARWRRSERDDHGVDRRRRAAGTASDAAIASDPARNASANAIAASKGGASSSAPVSARQGDDGPALGLRAVRDRQRPGPGQPPGPVRGDHDLVQPRAGQEPVGRHRRHRPGDGGAARCRPRSTASMPARPRTSAPRPRASRC